MAKVAVNWFAGASLILMGLYHILAGGPNVGRWLRSAAPSLTVREMTVGQLGFTMGGYLAIAIGLMFLLPGGVLPRIHYLYWAVVMLLLGGLSLVSFRSFHVSQGVLILALVFALCYFQS